MNNGKHGVKRSFQRLLFLLIFGPGLGVASGPEADITRAQAITRVQTILNNNAGPCRITNSQIVSSDRVKAGWRVAARIRMAGSLENAIWIVSPTGNAVPQNQLTAEIANGCP
jgi:hypothetical protein